MAGFRASLAAALALLLAAAAPPPPEAERLVPGGRSGYVTDGAGGCWIWMGGIPYGAEAIRTRWSGACPEGPAEGTGRSEMAWREAGRDQMMVYEGTLRRGKAEGQGTLTQTVDGTVTRIERGEYRADHLVEGRLELPQIGLVYEGRWLADRPQGQGRMTLDGQSFEGLWEAGCLKTERGWISFVRPPDQCQGQAT
jgi:hypothetical protein